MSPSRHPITVGERRNHPRFECDISIIGFVNTFDQAEMGPLKDARLLNVSLGSIAFISSQPIDEGCLVTVTSDKTPSRNMFALPPRFIVLETRPVNDSDHRYISRCQIIEGEVPIHWMRQHTIDRIY